MQIISMEEQDDGSVIWVLKFTGEEQKLIMNYYKRKRFTKKLAEKFILDTLKYYTKEYGESE